MELVIVDDGSTDGTWDAIDALSAADVRVRGVRLSRNFGHQSALMAGLAAARGRAVIMMDADLQHPPSLLPQLDAQVARGFSDRACRAPRPAEHVVVQAHDVEALLPAVCVHERRRRSSPAPRISACSTARSSTRS